MHSKAYRSPLGWSFLVLRYVLLAFVFSACNRLALPDQMDRYDRFVDDEAAFLQPKLPVLYGEQYKRAIEELVHIFDVDSTEVVWDNNSVDPFQICVALIQDNKVCRKTLKRNQSGINAKGKSGATIVHAAVRMKCNRRILHHIRYDSYPGINVNIRDNDGKTPLHYAVQQDCCCSDIRDFIDWKDVMDGFNIQDNYGQTPLHCAVQKKSSDPEFVKKLIKGGANLNIRDNVGQAVLHYAVQRGSYSIIELILKKLTASGKILDALNVQDNTGKTALHYAVVQDDVRSSKMHDKSLKIVKKLIVSGVDVNIRDNANQTALDYAKERNSHRIVHNLLKAGDLTEKFIGETLNR